MLNQRLLAHVTQRQTPCWTVGSSWNQTSTSCCTLVTQLQLRPGTTGARRGHINFHTGGGAEGKKKKGSSKVIHLKIKKNGGKKRGEAAVLKENKLKTEER